MVVPTPPTMPPVTTPRVSAEDLVNAARFVARWGPFAVLAAGLILVAVQHFRTRGPIEDRWRVDRDGTIHGPWLAKRRLRRAFAPLVDLGSPGEDATAAEWEAFAVGFQTRQNRRAERIWKHARVAFAVDARFVGWQVWPDRRVLTMRVGDHGVDTTRMMLRMGNLEVLGSHSDLGFDVHQVNAAEVVVTIVDAVAEPIEVPTKHVTSHLVTTTVNGESTVHKVDTPTDIMLVTGTRWRSLIDPDVTWEDATNPPGEEDAIMASDPVPDRGDPPVTRDDARIGSDRDRIGPAHISEPAPRQVRLLPAQRDLVRTMFTAYGPVQVWWLAKVLEREPSNVRRSLRRLAQIGLATTTNDDDWDLTDLGRQSVQLPAPDPSTGRTEP